MKTHVALVTLLVSSLVLAACASHRAPGVKCDAKLVPINAPVPETKAKEKE